MLTIAQDRRSSFQTIYGPLESISANTARRIGSGKPAQAAAKRAKSGSLGNWRATETDIGRNVLS